MIQSQVHASAEIGPSTLSKPKVQSVVIRFPQIAVVVGFKMLQVNVLVLVLNWEKHVVAIATIVIATVVVWIVRVDRCAHTALPGTVWYSTGTGY